MNEKAAPLSWAAVLMGFPLLAFVLGLPTPGSEASSAPPAGKPAPAAPPSSLETSPTLEPCLQRARSAAGRGYDLQYFVATLPDPADSLYARLFDLFTGSIRRAFEQLDYLQDGSCLPWPLGAEKPIQDPDGVPLYRREPGVVLFRHDGAAGQAVALSLVATRSYGPAGGAAAPPEPPRPKLAVVFLVGESPPWGVHAEALRRSLDFACVGGWPKAGSPPRLLAPSFSATTASLGVALKDWFAGEGTEPDPAGPGEERDEQAAERERARRLLNRHGCFGGLDPRTGKPARLEIVSGTATGSANEETLAAILSPPPATGLPPALPRDRWSYRSTATPNDLLEACMLDYFLPCRLGIATASEASSGPGERRCAVGDDSVPASVALLTESSVYGRDFGRKTRAGAEGAPDAGRPPGGEESVLRDKLLLLPFPMNVSSLRAEYEAQKAQLARGAGKVGGAELERSFLALRASEERAVRDGPRVYDLVGTTRTQDIELASILEVIARDRIQAVGIIATNIRDTLFLADTLRRYAPDVRLFTFEGDLLLAHPDYAAATRGMIVVSSNPLIEPDPVTEKNGDRPAEGDGEDSRSPDIRLKFSADTAQGVYEAARFLAAGGAEKFPPHEVWFSVVGNARLVPLKRVIVAGEGGGCRQRAPAQDPALWRRLASFPARLAELGTAEGEYRAAPPRGWSFVLSLLTGIILGLLVYLTSLLARGRSAMGGLLSRDLVWSGGAAPEPLSKGEQRVRHAFLVMIPLAVALPYLVLSGPVFFTRTRLVLRLVGALGLAALAATVGLLLWGLLRRTRSDLRGAGEARPATGRRLLTLAPLLAVMLLVATAGGVALVALSYLPKDGALAVVLDRLIAFGGGVSPLLPCLLLLAVVIGWVVLTLWRYRTLELLPQAEHLARRWSHLPERLRRGLEALRAAIDPAGFASRRLLTPGHLVLWSVLVLAPVLYLSFYYERRAGPLVHGVESPAFDAIVSGLFVLGLVAAVASGIALWQGWVGLRRLLGSLLDLRFSRGAEAAPGAGPAAGPGSAAPSGSPAPGTAPPAPSGQWLEPIKEVGKAGPDAGRILIERRNRAYDRFRAELRRQAAPPAAEPPADPEVAPAGPVAAGPAGDLPAHLEGLPADAASARPADFALAWLSLADWAGARGGEEPGVAEAEPPLLAPARDFFAWQTAVLSREASAQLVKLLSFMTFGLLGLWMAVSVYPFEPERVLGFIVGGLMAAGVAVTVAFVVQAEREPMLSHLAGTQANQISWHRTFLQRIALFAGVPILSLVTGRFPEVQRFLQQALEPAFKVLM